jgi:hypothetical protein
MTTTQQREPRPFLIYIAAGVGSLILFGGATSGNTVARTRERVERRDENEPDRASSRRSRSHLPNAPQRILRPPARPCPLFGFAVTAV